MSESISVPKQHLKRQQWSRGSLSALPLHDVVKRMDHARKTSISVVEWYKATAECQNRYAASMKHSVGIGEKGWGSWFGSKASSSAVKEAPRIAPPANEIIHGILNLVAKYTLFEGRRRQRLGQIVETDLGASLEQLNLEHIATHKDLLTILSRIKKEHDMSVYVVKQSKLSLHNRTKDEERERSSLFQLRKHIETQTALRTSRLRSRAKTTPDPLTADIMTRHRAHNKSEEANDIITDDYSRITRVGSSPEISTTVSNRIANNTKTEKTTNINKTEKTTNNTKTEKTTNINKTEKTTDFPSSKTNVKFQSHTTKPMMRNYSSTLERSPPIGCTQSESQAIQSQQMRWMRSCSIVDASVQKMADLQMEEEQCRSKLINTQEEIAKVVQNTEEARLQLLCDGLRRASKIELSVCEKRVQELTHLLTLLQYVPFFSKLSFLHTFVFLPKFCT